MKNNSALSAHMAWELLGFGEDGAFFLGGFWRYVIPFFPPFYLLIHLSYMVFFLWWLGEKRKGWGMWRQEKGRISFGADVFTKFVCCLGVHGRHPPGCPFNEFVDYQIKSVLSWSCKMFFFEPQGLVRSAGGFVRHTIDQDSILNIRPQEIPWTPTFEWTGGDQLRCT